MTVLEARPAPPTAPPVDEPRADAGPAPRQRPRRHRLRRRRRRIALLVVTALMWFSARAGDLFAAAGNNQFGPDTLPDSQWWGGAQSGLHLVQIGAPGPTVSFRTL